MAVHGPRTQQSFMHVICFMLYHGLFESLLSVLCDEGEFNRNNNSLVKKSFNIIHNFSLFQSEVGLERDHHGIVFSTHQNVHRCIGRTGRYNHHCRRSCASTSLSSQHNEVSDDEFLFSPPLEPLSTEPLAELDRGEANTC